VVGQPEREDGHGKATALGAIALAEPHKVAAVQAKPAGVLAKVLLHEVRWEQVNARRHRSVRRKNVPRRGHVAGRVKGDALLRHERADALQPEEGGMPLVHVTYRGLDADDTQGAHAADAQHDLLADAHVLVPAV
jgi:hypothetical protein